MGAVDSCLVDSGCLTITIAGITGGIAACKRAYSAADLAYWGSWLCLLMALRRTITAAILHGAGSAAGTVIAVELGTSAKVAACVAVLVSLVTDFATAEGKAWILRILKANAKAMGLADDDRPKLQ